MQWSHRSEHTFTLLNTQLDKTLQSELPHISLPVKSRQKAECWDLEAVERFVMQLKSPGFFCFFSLYTRRLCWMECSSGVDPVGWQGGTGGAAASTGHQQGEWRTVIVSAGTSDPGAQRDERRAVWKDPANCRWFIRRTNESSEGQTIVLGA